MGSGNSRKPEIDKEDTIFDKIVRGDIKSEKLFEDKYTVAFKNIKPCAPVHFLVIPKNWNGLTSLFKAENKHIDIMGWMMLTASKVAAQ